MSGRTGHRHPLFCLLQGFQQGLGSFTGSSKIADILQLDWIDTTAVFYIHKVDDVELAVFRCLSCFLVDAVVVVQLLCERRELIVIDHHCKALGTVLTDKRLND